MFGGGTILGLPTLWKLTRNTDGSFDWNIISMENHETPSPRHHHCGWEYGDKMWIFGGCGDAPVGYGTFGPSNELFTYDPSKQTWTNVECFGVIPSPRESPSAAVIRDRAWLFGGFTTLGWENELHELNMNLCAWTHIYTFVPASPGFRTSFLAPPTTNQLMLHGYSDDEEGGFTWILDVNKSYQWRQYPAGDDEHCFCQEYSSTGISGLNNDVIIIGGHTDSRSDKPVSSVMLEPKSLQQMAMIIIQQNKTNLPWKSLPHALRRRFTSCMQ